MTLTMPCSHVCSHHVHRLVATLVCAQQARSSAHGDHRTARDRSDPLGATHNIGGRHAAKNDILEAKLERRARSSCNPSLRVREPPKQPLARLPSGLMGQAPYMLQTREKNSSRLDWYHFNDKSRKKVCPNMSRKSNHHRAYRNQWYQIIAPKRGTAGGTSFPCGKPCTGSLKLHRDQKNSHFEEI